MISTSSGAVEEPQDRAERRQRWLAALVTVLVHVLLILLVLQEPEIVISTPQGEAGGSRMNVTLIDGTLPPAPAEPEPPVHQHVAPKKPKAPRAIKRPLPTPSMEASLPMPAEEAATTDAAPVPPTTPSEPPEAPPPASTTPPTHVYGQPPGMRPDANAIANAALAAKLGSGRGRADTPAPAGPAMGVDGFQVLYDLANAPRLREWRDKGMTELFLPMPGTRRLMVCPLEVALRRGSSECRMVNMDDPGLKTIGDAREVIDIQRVYQLGDVVWSGPGPYR